MTWYVSLQQVDWDDYPMGDDTKIGPFGSKEIAERWLEDSPKFHKVQYAEGFYTWRRINHGRLSVNIKNLLDTYMTEPENF